MYSAFFQGISPVLPLLLLLGAMLVSLLIAYFSYRDVDKGGAIKKWLLISLRASVLLILIFLLLNPFISFESSTVETPQIAVYLDNSRSISVERGEYGGLPVYRESIQNFRDERDARFDYTTFLFDSEVYPGDELTAEGTATHLNAVVNHLRENENRYKAALLFSDGISTMGRDPAFAAAQVTTPVITIPLGDTLSIRDIAIAGVEFSDPVYTNTVSRIVADVQYQQTQGERTEVRLLENGTLVESREIQFQSETGSRLVEFEKEFPDPGFYDLIIEAVPLEDEFTTDNNRFSFTTEVLDDQTRILSLAFEIHPDVAAIRNLIGTDIQNELINATWTGGDRFAGTNPLNESFDWEDLDLLILHGEPPAGSPIAETVRDAAGTLSLLTFSLPSTYREDSFSEYSTPIGLNSVQTPVDVRPVLVSNDLSHPLLELTVPAGRSVPPLKTYRGDYNLSPAAQTLLNGEFQGGPTEIPLLAAEETGSRRKASVNAYGWYRYKLSRQDDSGKFFNELMTNLVSWTSTPPDRRSLIVEPAKNRFTENETVHMRGTLFNERGDPEPNGIIELQLHESNSEREEARTFRMRHVNSGNYTAELGQLPEGSYRVVAEAMFNNRVIGTDEARLAIGRSSIELVNTRRDDATLRNIAGGSGGLFLENHDISSLNRFLAEQNLYESNEERSIEHSYIREFPIVWFIVVLALLTTEWLLRRSLSLV